MAETDLGAAVSKLLADPEAMSGIMQMASAFMGSGDAEKTTQGDEEQHHDSAQNQPVPSTVLPDLSSLMQLAQTGRRSANCELLSALRPFVNQNRAEKIDELIKALKLFEVMSIMLQGFNKEH